MAPGLDLEKGIHDGNDQGLGRLVGFSFLTGSQIIQWLGSDDDVGREKH